MEMAGQLPRHPSLHSTVGDEACSIFHDVAEGLQCLGPGWYLSRKEIEDSSPSRMDGIDLKKETQLRNLYCSFLHDIGKKLKVPQVTIATAMMFCHRFYLRQSLARNEWQTIATACMFLASKVEETPCLLMDVVVVAYETMYRRDPVAAQRIKQKEVFEKQKELILTAERVLLSTIGYDFNVQHPYTPLVSALKKFKIANDVGKVAWNFVNDWLRTTLCLQYKPHYIAAGSLFLAAKFCRVKLPSHKGMVWWHEFDITPRKFEEVTQQMLNTVEQNRKTVTPRAREKVMLAPLVAEKAASDSPESCVLNGSAIATTSSHALEKGGRDYPANSLSCSHHGKDLALANNDTHVAGGGYLECQISDCGSAHSIVEDVERSEGADQAAIESNHIVGSVIISVCEGIEDGKRYEGVDQSRIESNRIVGSSIISVCQSLEDGKRLNEGEDQTRIGSNNLITGSSNISACKFLAESDIARIKAKLKRKRCERAMDAEEAPLMEDVASNDAWIERALENGIVPGVEKTQKKQRQI